MSFDLVEGKPRDLGGFSVRRVLPSLAHRAVGPFVFFDHLGPATLAAGSGGVQVRPHPHIGLATVTYLFDGELCTATASARTRPSAPATSTG